MFDFDILGFKMDLFLICLLYLLPGFALLGFTLFDAALLNFTVVCMLWLKRGPRPRTEHEQEQIGTRRGHECFQPGPNLFLNSAGVTCRKLLTTTGTATTSKQEHYQCAFRTMFHSARTVPVQCPYSARTVPIDSARRDSR